MTIVRVVKIQPVIGAFEQYNPPTGISIAWKSGFKGQEGTEMLAAFIAAEKTAAPNARFTPEKLEAEIVDNRCFTIVEKNPTIDATIWPELYDMNFDFTEQVPITDPRLPAEWTKDVPPEEQFDSLADAKAIDRLNDMYTELGFDTMQPKEVLEAEDKEAGKTITVYKLSYLRLSDPLTSKNF